MADPYLQDKRFLFVETPLGPNKLLLESYTGEEGVSQLFSFQLELLSENNGIDFAALLGRKIHFGVAGPEGATKRHIHGIVTSFAQLPSRERLARYRAAVSPAVWKLTRKQNSRIFQKVTVVDILKKVLETHDVVYETRATYAEREYCVQYRESDFAFLSRLMEEEGIYYFFRQSDDGDKLVIADSPASHPGMPGGSRLRYDELEGGERDEARISDWQKTQHWDSGKCTLRDYYFETPRANLQAQKEILPSVQAGKVTHQMSVGGNAPDLEIYDYPGNYTVKSYGEQLVAAGMQQIETAQFVIRGKSNVHNLIPGYRFTLEGHFNGDGPYLVTSVSHSASEGAYHSTATGAGQDHFSNTFTCIPFALPYRPPRQTPRPQVRGCQTAVVVGPSGEEIFTDKYGRVKVQFHWDREGKNDEKSSCWMRVASFWAGKNWGAVHLPRIGQEVVVDFLEGDPDRPLIVGSVYNADNMPPYALPGERTKSCVKSRSSKGGGASNFNEIRFEDKIGSEEVYFQAEKDLNTLVKNDETRDIGHDVTIKVGNNRTVTITMNDSETVQGSQDISVMQNQDVKIMGNGTTTIMGSEDHTATSRTTTVASTDSLTVTATISITAGGNVTITAPMISLSAAMVQVAGVLQCATLITNSVVSPVYTPGAGNIW